MGYFQNPPGPSHDNFTASLQSMAIVANGDVHPAISSGQFVYVREHSTLSEGLYKASSSIAQDATLSTSNLTAVSGGGMNSLNEHITNLNSKLEKRSVSFTISNISANGGGSVQVTFPTISGKTPVMANIRLIGGYNLLTAWLQDWNSSYAEVRAWNGRTGSVDCSGYVDILYW